MIVGGDYSGSTGIEVWNPSDGSVKLLADKHPQETGTAAINGAVLISVASKFFSTE